MDSQKLEGVRTVTQAQIREMFERDRDLQQSSFRLDDIYNVLSLVLYDENDRLLAYAGHQSLVWDTEVLGLRSARITYLWSFGDYCLKRQRLSRLIKESIDQQCVEHVEFISARISCDNIASIHALEDNGFRIIESYLTFVSRLPTPCENFRRDDLVRPAAPSEVDAVSYLAFQAFRYNRYMTDQLLPEKQARHSRLVWVQNAFNGRAEAIYLAEFKKEIAGFVILRTIAGDDGSKIGRIDLIAVDYRFAGQGIACALISQAFQHYLGKVDQVQVATQASNIAAVNLYQKMGFSLLRSEYSLHWHSALH